MARSRDNDAQRERLSAATWTVMARDGVNGLTLRAVAAEAGCTTGLVLHTFPDKRALLLHARDLLHSRGRDHADTIDDGSRDAGEVLHLFLLHSVALDQDRLDEARVWLGFLGAALSDEVLAERHRAGNHAFLERCTGLLLRAVDGIDEAEASERAVMLSAAVEGLNTLATADPEYYDAARQRRVIDTAYTAATAAIL